MGDHPFSVAIQLHVAEIAEVVVGVGVRGHACLEQRAVVGMHIHVPGTTEVSAHAAERPRSGGRIWIVEEEETRPRFGAAVAAGSHLVEYRLHERFGRSARCGIPAGDPGKGTEPGGILPGFLAQFTARVLIVAPLHGLGEIGSCEVRHRRGRVLEILRYFRKRWFSPVAVRTASEPIASNTWVPML